MFRDTQEELQRIQQQLLEEDIPETDEELLEDIADLVDDVQEGYEPDEFYNNDYTDLDPEELIRDNEENLRRCREFGCEYILIDSSYTLDINRIFCTTKPENHA